VPIVALHSNLSQKERLRGWLAAKTGEAKIIIGTRSAIFTPFSKLGLIIVDEEHDASFKQQDHFRYHARDLAIMRAQMNQIPIVLGSATPSLESQLNAKRKRYHYLSLPKRAGNAVIPQYQFIDLRISHPEEGLSPVLLDAIREHLAQDSQVMLFLNRRGFAPVLYCTECAWMACCRRCDSRMVYHRSPAFLQCHQCDLRHLVPSHCVACGKSALQPVGLGTQRLQQTLEKYFPEIPIFRVDRDNTKRKEAMQDLLLNIHKNEKAILLGTQMLAKGHHFPQVTLVGIVDADSGLFSTDFRAAESMGQLLLQVSGRAGRAEKAGKVLIQTRHPEHPLLQTLIYQGYSPFSQTLLLEREQSVLPPFSYLAIFRAEAYIEQNAHLFLTAIKEMGATIAHTVTILGPVPALLARRKGLHCQHLLIKASQRSGLQSFLSTILKKIEKISSAQQVKWILDVDPAEI
jgi:primosomal protein N' (replication factor Y)